MLTESFDTIQEIDKLKAQGAVTAFRHATPASRRADAGVHGGSTRAGPTVREAQPAAGSRVSLKALVGSRNISPGEALTSSADLAEVVVEALSQLPPVGRTEVRRAAERGLPAVASTRPRRRSVEHVEDRRHLRAEVIVASGGCACR